MKGLIPCLLVHVVNVHDCHLNREYHVIKVQAEQIDMLGLTDDFYLAQPCKGVL